MNTQSERGGCKCRLIAGHRSRPERRGAVFKADGTCGGSATGRDSGRERHRLADVARVDRGSDGRGGFCSPDRPARNLRRGLRGRAGAVGGLDGVAEGAGRGRRSRHRAGRGVKRGAGRQCAGGNRVRCPSSDNLRQMAV